jgi:hypothetical protein
MAEGLRASGFTHVETSVIAGALHYDVQDQPDTVGRTHRATCRADVEVMRRPSGYSRPKAALWPAGRAS